MVAGYAPSPPPVRHACRKDRTLQKASALRANPYEWMPWNYGDARAPSDPPSSADTAAQRSLPAGWSLKSINQRFRLPSTG